MGLLVRRECRLETRLAAEHGLESRTLDWAQLHGAMEGTHLFNRLDIGRHDTGCARVERHRGCVRIRCGYADNRRQPERRISLAHPRERLTIERNVLRVDEHEIQS